MLCHGRSRWQSCFSNWVLHDTSRPLIFDATYRHLARRRGVFGKYMHDSILVRVLPESINKPRAPAARHNTTMAIICVRGNHVHQRPAHTAPVAFAERHPEFLGRLHLFGKNQEALRLEGVRVRVVLFVAVPWAKKTSLTTTSPERTVRKSRLEMVDIMQKSSSQKGMHRFSRVVESSLGRFRHLEISHADLMNIITAAISLTRLSAYQD